MTTTTRFTLAAILMVALMGLAIGCGKSGPEAETDTTPPPPAPAPATIADDDLSYRNEALIDDSDVPVVDYTAEDPGDSELVDRAFENSPPIIPHTVEDLLPITVDDNQCIECHLPEMAADVGATAVPASHLYDIRRDKQLDGLNPANFYCTLCHAPQAQTDPLVANNFEPYWRAQERLKSSDLLDQLNEGVE